MRFVLWWKKYDLWWKSASKRWPGGMLARVWKGNVAHFVGTVSPRDCLVNLLPSSVQDGSGARLAP